MLKWWRRYWWLILLAALTLLFALTWAYGQWITRPARTATVPASIAVSEQVATAKWRSHSQYVTLADEILTDLTSRTDAHGFYGQSHTCHRQNKRYICTVDAYPDTNGVATASFRQTIDVIWARFKLFEATGDQTVKPFFS